MRLIILIIILVERRVTPIIQFTSKKPLSDSAIKLINKKNLLNKLFNYPLKNLVLNQS